MKKCEGKTVEWSVEGREWRGPRSKEEKEDKDEEGAGIQMKRDIECEQRWRRKSPKESGSSSTFYMSVVSVVYGREDTVSAYGKLL